MSRQYHYFVASLPMVSFEGRPPFSLEEFLIDAKRLLVKEDFALIEELLLSDESMIARNNQACRDWLDFDHGLKNEIAWQRAQHLHLNPLEHIKGERYANPYFSEVIAQAKKEDNLLEGEKILDKARWQFLDNLESGHFFDLEVIIIYALKLKILSRYQAISAQTGKEILEKFRQVEHERW